MLVVFLVEVLLGLVPSVVFKANGASRKRTYGGFDSRAFPPLASASAEAFFVEYGAI